MKSTYVEYIPNHGSVPTPLIRQSWRENGRVKRRTLCNLSKLEPHLVEGIRLVLKGGAVFPDIHDAVSLRRSLPHGHVAAVAGTMRKLGFERLLHRKPGRERSLAFAAVAARVVEPCSKLATARRLSPATASSSLGAVLGLGAVTGNEMLGMLDWLRARQRWIERSLAARHLRDGTLLLYDVTSSYLEGRCCPLAGFGHNRDGKKGKKQIVYGLLCAADGCPVAVEVFAGGTGDPATVAVQVAKVKQRFGLSRIAFVGDRGMVTAARIRDDLLPAGLDWISALRTPDIRQLARAPVRRTRTEPAGRRCFVRRSWCRRGGGGFQSGLSGRAPDRVLQSAPEGGTGAQAGGSAAGHRTRPGRHRQGRPQPARALAWTRRDQPPGRPGHQPPQGGQALRYRDLGWPHRLGAQRGADRRRSTPRRRLRDPHQPRGRRPRRAGGGGGL